MSPADEQLHFILPGVAASADASARAIGSKAQGLQKLARLGLPVPPAFVIGTEFCRAYFESGGTLPDSLRVLLARGLARLEEATGQGFGQERRPLLVSVRSGAPVSMPGMMDTILNIGLCETSLRGLLRATGNPRLVQDCHRRLIRDFSQVVHAADAGAFDRLVTRYCAGHGLAGPGELDGAGLRQVVQDSLELAMALTTQPFPDDPMEQLVAAVEAVFRSWNSPKARAYRRLNSIDDRMGTAVTIQAMVFGNLGGLSGAGVGFTRDPAAGHRRLFLDFQFNAQGEDVVSGRQSLGDSNRLARRLPAVAAELARIAASLEIEFQEVQDFEFTVEEGRLYLLQTRAAKLAPRAALKVAIDMVNEELISPTEGLRRVDRLDPAQFECLRLADGADRVAIAQAVPASAGIAVGSIAFDPDHAAALIDKGKTVILLREDMATDDIAGIAVADGVLTARGGRTSHAAVVARQLGKVCLVGCASLRINPDGRSCTIGDLHLTEGDELTLDGDGGRVFSGCLPVTRQSPDAELAEVARWRAAAPQVAE